MVDTIELYKKNSNIFICLRNFNDQQSVRVSVDPKVSSTILSEIRKLLPKEKKKELNKLIPKTYGKSKTSGKKHVVKVDQETWQQLAVILGKNIKVHFFDNDDGIETWIPKYNVSADGVITPVKLKSS